VANSTISLSAALWDIDPSMVREQVQWLASLPLVGHVQLRATATGELFEAGDPVDGRAPAVSLPIPPPRHSQSLLPLGELQVWENRGHYLEVLRDSTLRVLLGYALFTALVCLMVAWVMRRQLRQPLQQIARFAAQLKPNELSRPLVLDRPLRGQLDEIDLVVQGFAQLQQDLRGHIEHLDLLVAERTGQMQELVEEVKRMSLTDALTGCHNRRAMDERLAAEVESSQDRGQALSVMFVDVDRFKQVNDRHGHAAGDAVLREVARRCRNGLGASAQWMARYGGEEFLIVLPQVGADEARHLAQQLRQAIRSTPVQACEMELAVTASFGVAQLRAADGAQELLQRADAMLYEAKHGGRDCVRVADPA
jgi:diguanylate cyclase (GGDEF)-like protein